MAKESGLGDNLFIGRYNVSGDVGSVGTISGGNAPLEVTAIDKSAMERLGGLRSGTIEYTSFFNTSANQSHLAHRGLFTTDRTVTYLRGTTLGNAAASMEAKQINYDPTRGADGSLTFAVQCLSNAYGLEWGVQLTAGVRTDTAATNGTGVDTLASLSFGGQAFLHVTAFTGTDATVKIQDSADNVSFADVTSFVFTAVTGTTSERIAITNTSTIRRYVRVATTTSGGFTSMSFVVNMVKNELAGQVY